MGVEAGGLGPEAVIVARTRDIGGFEVRRALPAPGRRMVGPFIFLDQMGPHLLRRDQGIDVRPHPHIGLATVTYLFDGSLFHRDSLGTEQDIRPGDVNWMTAGSGIAHSERSSQADRRLDRSIFGIQSWVALPREHEEAAPGFAHFARADLPALTDDGVALRVVAGSAFGLVSPVSTLSETLYVDVGLSRGAAIELPTDHEERAVYVAAGAIDIAGDRFEAGNLLIFRPGDRIAVRATHDARFVILGGEPMDGPRHIWWNFVSSSKDRIEAAKADWKAGRFAPVIGETELVPLPE